MVASLEGSKLNEQEVYRSLIGMVSTVFFKKSNKEDFIKVIAECEKECGGVPSYLSRDVILNTYNKHIKGVENDPELVCAAIHSDEFRNSVKEELNSLMAENSERTINWKKYLPNENK